MLLLSHITYEHYIGISRLEYVASDGTKTLDCTKWQQIVLSLSLVITDNNDTLLHDGTPTACDWCGKTG
jgi:hypothetical protein